MTLALPFSKLDIMDKKYNASYLSRVKHLKKYTLNPEVAVEAAKQSGRKPIEHISPRVRAIYAKAYPKLNKVVK